jgi:hypothetical protein
MGNIKLKSKKTSFLKRDSSTDVRKNKFNIKFVLTDVSKQELEKRRIPVYSFVI